MSLNNFMVNHNLKGFQTPAERMMENAERIIEFEHRTLSTIVSTWLGIVHDRSYSGENSATYVRERKTVCWFWDLKKE